MVLRYLSVIGDAPEAFVILIAAFVFSMLVGLSFHEFSHAYVADRLGDRTPRSFGRLTLNPRAHFDPVGSTMILFVGFGWAKPVPVNPFNTRNPQRSMAMIASAGPVANLSMAALAGLPIQLGWVPFWHPFISPGLASAYAQAWTDTPQDLMGLFLGTVVLLNVLLAVFNLLPLAPLDGFRVAVGLLPRDLSVQVARIEPWGPGILFTLILLPFLSGGDFNPLFTVMGPLIDFFLEVFVGGGLPLRFG
jgi:Zn-dependent protease